MSYYAVRCTVADTFAIYLSPLPLYLQDIIWSDYAIDHQSHILPYLRFKQNNFHHNQHPPWHVHLFYADLLAANLLDEFTQCSLRDRNNNNVHKTTRSDRINDKQIELKFDKQQEGEEKDSEEEEHQNSDEDRPRTWWEWLMSWFFKKAKQNYAHKGGVASSQTTMKMTKKKEEPEDEKKDEKNNEEDHDKNTSPKNKLITNFVKVAELPDPLYKDNQSYCDLKGQPLLEISALDLYPTEQGGGDDKEKESVRRRYVSSPPGAWQLTEERKGKAGWVSSFPTTLGLSFDDSCEKGGVKKGGKCLELEEEEEEGMSSTEAIAPTRNLTIRFTDPKNELNKRIHLLRIHYFRTYTNAGVVDVLLCGHRIGTLDGLWMDYKTYRFSMNSVFVAEYNPFMGHGSCKPKVNDKGVEVTPELSITFRHRFSRALSTKEARTVSQKVKIVSVSICKMATEKKQQSRKHRR